jgi:hypothetical protein
LKTVLAATTRTASAQAHARVLALNRARASSLAKWLRRRNAGVLIDPTALLRVPGWSQDDYRYFWARVIGRYVRRVIFANGWAYSNGCAFEFLVAYRHGVKTLSESGKSLSLEEGIGYIDAAVRELDAEGVSADFLSRVAAALRRASRTAARRRHHTPPVE